MSCLGDEPEDDDASMLEALMNHSQHRSSFSMDIQVRHINIIFKSYTMFFYKQTNERKFKTVSKCFPTPYSLAKLDDNGFLVFINLESICKNQNYVNFCHCVGFFMHVIYSHLVHV